MDDSFAFWPGWVIDVQIWDMGLEFPEFFTEKARFTW